MTTIDDFRFRLPLEVRFADLDGMVHVNNAKFATYLEVGRTEYFRRVVGITDIGGVDFILARLEIDFLRPIALFEPVELGLKVPNVGRTSFGFEYLMTAAGEPAARAKSVQVFYDYAAGSKKEVPAHFREAVTKFEELA